MIDSHDRENKEKTTSSPPLIPPKKEESQKKSSLLQKLANKLERISKIPERGKKEVEIIRFIEKVSQLEETPEILLVKAASLEHYSNARYSIVAFFYLKFPAKIVLQSKYMDNYLILCKRRKVHPQRWPVCKLFLIVCALATESSGA